MRRVFTGLFLAALVSLPALGQEQKRLDELERRAAEQQKELEALREAEELRRAGDAPPHVERPSGTPAEQTFSWGYDDGFFVRGSFFADPEAEPKDPGVTYLLRPRAYIQLDYRGYAHSRANLAFPSKGVADDHFVLRRAVIGFVADLGPFSFMFEAEPVRGASGLIPLLNAWLEWRSFEVLQVRAGHFIPPFTLADAFTAPPFYDFVEEPMIVQSLTYSFRPGAMAKGSFEKGLVSWFLAVNNEVDTNGTVTGDPIATTRLSSAVGPVQLGAAGAWERRAGVQPSLVASTPGVFQFFAPVNVQGWTQRYEVDLAVGSGPFFGSTEFCWGHQERRRVLPGGLSADSLVVQGAYGTVGWMFCGPPPGVKGPHVPFEGWELFSLDLERHRNARNVGAELLVRLEWLSVGAGDLKGNDARAVSVGLNVYPMENVKFMLDFDHARIGDQATAERAHSRYADEVQFRAQLEF